MINPNTKVVPIDHGWGEYEDRTGCVYFRCE